MNPLTLDKAFQLYDIIGKYVPEIDEDSKALEFIGTIVRNIKDSNNHRDYVDAVILMSDKSWDEVKELKFDEVLELFIEGLSVNKIIELKSFCEDIGYSDA